MRPRFASALALAACCCALLAGCQSGPRPEKSSAPAARRAPETAAAPAPENWVRTELFFGIAPAEAEGLGLSAAEGTWKSFLDEEVTPRFPDGLTVFEAYGQWREDEKTPVERIRSRVLVIVHPATPAKRAGIDALCAAFKARTGEKEVLVIETPIASPRF